MTFRGEGSATADSPARSGRSPLALVVVFVLLVLYTGRLGPVVADLLLVLLLVQAVRSDMTIPRHPAVVATAVVVVIAGIQVATDIAGGARDLSMIITNLGAIYAAGFAFALYALLRRWEASVGRVEVWDRVRAAIERAVPIIVVLTALLALRLVAMPTFGGGLPAPVRPIVFEASAVMAPTLAFTLPVLTSARDGSLAARWRRPLLGAWAASVVVFAFEGRAVALGVGLGLGITYLRPARMLRVLYVVVALLVLLWVSGVSLRAGTREISFDTAVEAAGSVVGSQSGSGSDLYQTKEWRTDWWEEIVADIRDEPFLVTGHGWDVSLGDQYGMNDARIRSGADLSLVVFPHNLFLTLAGLGGVVLATMFFTIPALTLARTRRAVRSDGAPVVAGARAAIVAGLVVSMTGVLIEGSSGGSLFWLLIGLLWWAEALPIEVAVPTGHPEDA